MGIGSIWSAPRRSLCGIGGPVSSRSRHGSLKRQNCRYRTCHPNHELRLDLCWAERRSRRCDFDTRRFFAPRWMRPRAARTSGAWGFAWRYAWRNRVAGSHDNCNARLRASPRRGHRELPEQLSEWARVRRRGLVRPPSDKAVSARVLMTPGSWCSLEAL
ncbi:MAG: hypothetical protein ACI9S9_000879 [Planctomycetota bacterium]|jgi:hypothetical protein